jgi:hypothetical protein
MNPNFALVIAAAIFVGSFDRFPLTVAAEPATVAGGFVVARREQVRGARWDRDAALNNQTSQEN